MAASPLPQTRRTEQAVVALAAAAALVAYALPSGSYDLVTRHQAAIAVWFFLAAGLALGVFPRVLPRGGAAVLAGLLLGLAVLQALSATWSESADRSLAEAARTLHHLGILLLASIALSRRTWRPAVAGLTAGAALICGLAVLSRLNPTTEQLAVIAGGLDAERTSAPFDYFNAVGAWAAMTALLAVAWGSSAASRAGQALGAALVPLAALTVYLTLSRTALGALALGALVLLALSPRRIRVLLLLVAGVVTTGAVIAVVRSQPQIATGTGTSGAGPVAAVLVFACAICGAAAVAASRLPERQVIAVPHARRVALGLGGAVALALAVALPFAAGNAWEQFRDSSAPSFQADPSGQGDPSSRLTSLSGTRYLLYASSFTALESKPLLGRGAGTFEFWWTREGRDRETVRDAHSLALESAAELGIAGLLIALAISLALVWAPLRSRLRLLARPEAGIAAGLTAAAFAYAVMANLDWMWESTAVTVLALALVGAATASGARDDERSALRLRLPLALLALVIVGLQAPSLLSLTAQRDSRVEVRQGQLAGALADAGRARSWAPWAADPVLQEALVLQRLGKLGASRTGLALAESREPTNWRIPLSRARLDAQDGRAKAALGALRRARRLHPTAPFLRPPQRGE